MNLFRADTMRRVDEAAVAAGHRGRTLMEAAGRAVTDAVLAAYPRAQRVVVLCGRGNNGGDGHVIARLLADAGRHVRRYELGAPTRSDAADARRAADAALGPALALAEATTLERDLADSDLLIDALFGSGLSRPLTGPAAETVTAMNGSGIAIVSVDVPSGVDADRAEAPGPYVRAAATVQLAGAKLASVLFPIRSAYGRSSVVSIGIPAELLDSHADGELMTGARLRPFLPQRARDAHKYRVGTVMIFAGSARYLGAAELACRAAYRAGAGLVTLAAEARYPGGWPEVVLQPLGDGGAVEALAAAGGARSHTLVIGPGLDGAAPADIAKLLSLHPGYAVLDAGALLADERLRAAVLSQRRCLLTPHHGEAARLLGMTTAAVGQDPVTAATALAQRWGALVILKGAATVIADPQGRLLISDRGDPGMAVGGSGDVLAGLLGAWAGGDDPLWRAAAATFMHGLAGERAAARLGNGLIAGDVIEELPAAWRSLQGDA